MSAAPVTKRRHVGKPGERRRGDKGDGSSRDASEEDNEEGTSDVDSLASSHHARLPHAHAGAHGHAGGAGINSVHRRALSQKKVSGAGGEVSDGVDSPVYDGDVESSSTIGGTPVHSTFAAAGQHHIRRPSSPTPLMGPVQGNALGAPVSGNATIPPPETSSAQPTARLPAQASHTSDDAAAVYTNITAPPTDVPVAPSEALSPAIKSQLLPLSTKASVTSQGPPRMMSRPKELSDEDIKAFVQRAIDGEGAVDGVERWWRTRKPPTDRPVRIYADGVYDLFHFGHALQLRQAKLSFPSVQLIVGVCSDQLCAAHKSAPAMTHAERCEAVRHCRWADEVVPDAPWVVDQAFMDKYQIDYLAHDELVYPSKDMEDVYAFAKEKGVFLPTRRTPSISTSDLLERIVRGYRDGFFDSKLEKNGHPELVAADVDWDSSASIEKRERRKKGKGGVAVQPLSTTDAQ